MKTITLSHYQIRNIEPKPWKETWENLMEFVERMTPKLAPMQIRLKLRKVIMDDVSQESLMMGNMVTIESEEIGVEETPIENLLMIELAFSPCEDCKTTEDVPFACRTFIDFDGVKRQALPQEFFMEAVLRVAFQAENSGGCGCSSCSSCASGCGDEEQGERDEHHKHH